MRARDKSWEGLSLHLIKGEGASKKQLLKVESQNGASW